MNVKVENTNCLIDECFININGFVAIVILMT